MKQKTCGGSQPEIRFLILFSCAHGKETTRHTHGKGKMIERRYLSSCGCSKVFARGDHHLVTSFHSQFNRFFLSSLASTSSTFMPFSIRGETHTGNNIHHLMVLFDFLSTSLTRSGIREPLFHLLPKNFNRRSIYFH